MNPEFIIPDPDAHVLKEPIEYEKQFLNYFLELLIQQSNL